MNTLGVQCVLIVQLQSVNDSQTRNIYSQHVIRMSTQLLGHLYIYNIVSLNHLDVQNSKVVKITNIRIVPLGCLWGSKGHPFGEVSRRGRGQALSS